MVRRPGRAGRFPEIEDPQAAVPRARSMQLSNFSPATRAFRAAVVADNVRGLALRGVEYRWPEGGGGTPMHGLCCRNVSGLADDSPRLASNRDGLARTVVLDPFTENRTS